MKTRWALNLLIILLGLLLCCQKALAVSLRVSGVSFEKKVKNMKEMKNQNVVHQSLDYSCGAAGLSTILNYYLNEPISEKDIIDSILKNVDVAKVRARKGFSLLDLKNFSEAMGYKVTGYKMDFDYLQELKKPVLVPIKFKNYRHFVIVRGVVGDRVFIADPAVGNMTMKINRFESIWLNGIGLVIERAASIMQSQENYLAIKEEEAVFADYRSIMNMLPGSVIRTAIFPNEY